MKNYLFLFVLSLALFNCSQNDPSEDLINEEVVVDDFTELSRLASKADSDKAGSSEDNPIVVGADTFIDHVRYVIPICNIPNNTFALEHFGGTFFGSSSGTNTRRSRYRLNSSGCGELIPDGEVVSAETEFRFGVFYEINGIVVRIFDPFNVQNGFWFTSIPNSDQVRKVTFFANGTFQLGATIDFPFQTDLDCSNAIDYPSGNFVVSQFPRGQRAVRFIANQNFLYVSDGGGFRFLGSCATDGSGGSTDGNTGGDTVTPPAPVVVDICDGIDSFNRFTRYRRGDQVTFRGFLFQKTRRSWRNLGECGTN